MSEPYQTPRSDLFQKLWDAQNGQCALCAAPMLQNRFEAPHASVWAKRRATFDHIIPKSKGGSDARENLQLAHAQCNKIKGNKV